MNRLPGAKHFSRPPENKTGETIKVEKGPRNRCMFKGANGSNRGTRVTGEDRVLFCLVLASF